MEDNVDIGGDAPALPGPVDEKARAAKSSSSGGSSSDESGSSSSGELSILSSSEWHCGVYPKGGLENECGMGVVSYTRSCQQGYLSWLNHLMQCFFD